MASRKQRILCELLYQGLLSLRIICTAAAKLSLSSIEENRHVFLRGWEEANFLHNVPRSILESEFVDNDINFINFAFPAHIERMGPMMSSDTARLMIELYELVPQSLRAELTWKPNAELRQLAAAHGSLQ